MSGNRYAIYGLGGFGRETFPLIAASHDTVFVDDSDDRPSMYNDARVLSFEELISDEHKDRKVIAAMGDGRVRKRVEDKCSQAGLDINTIVAPTARIIGSNEIGPGAVLCDFACVTADAKIGKSFQANIYSYVAHDCEIGDYVTFAPRVSCNGNVKIGDFAYVGTGASLLQGEPGKPLTIGEGAFVGMGAVVTKNVEPYAVVAGNPARFIRKLEPKE